MNPQTQAVLIKLLETSEASLAAARVLLEDLIQVEQQGPCSHPSQAVKKVTTFGKQVALCELCGEFIQGDSDERD